MRKGVQTIIFLCILFYSCVNSNNNLKLNSNNKSINNLLFEIDTLISSPQKLSDKHKTLKYLIENKKNNDSLLSVLKEELTVHPDSIELHMLYQDCMLNSGLRSTLINYYSDSLKIHPKSAAYNYLFGRIQQNLKEEWKYSKKASELNPSFIWSNITYLNYLEKATLIDTVEILNTCIKTLNLNNQFAACYEKLLGYYTLWFNDSIKAKHIAEKLYNSDTLNITYLENLEYVYKKFNFIEINTELQNKLLSKNSVSKDEIWFNLAKLNAIQNNFNKTYQYLELISPQFLDRKKIDKEESFIQISKEKRFKKIIKTTSTKSYNIKRKNIENKIKTDVLSKNEFEFIMTHYENGKNYNKCISYCKTQLKISNNSSFINFSLAKYEYLKENYSAAISILEKLVKNGFCNKNSLVNTFSKLSENEKFTNLIHTIEENTQEFTKQFTTKQYRVSDGISHINVWSIFQDSCGYLWVGTEAGLNKYDGYTFESYTPSNGMNYRYITGIENDKNGELTFLTRFDGIIKYDNNTFTQHAEQSGFFMKGGISPIVKDDNNNLLIGSNNGLTIYDGATFKNFTTADGLPHNSVNFILKTDSIFWIATHKGICKFDGNKFYDYYSTQNGLPSNKVFTLAHGKNNSLWIGTNYGLANLKDKKIKSYFKEDGLNSNIIFKLLTDKDGNVWILTFDKGVNVLRNGNFIPFDLNSSSENPMCIYQDSYNDIWIGYFVGALYKIQKKDFLIVNKYKNHDIIKVLTQKNSTPYFQTKNHKIINKKGEVVCDLSGYPSIYNEGFRSTFVDSKNRFWFGLKDNSFAMFESGKITIFPIHAKMKNARGATEILEDRDGNIWFAMWGAGLLKYDGEIFIAYNIENGLHANNVMDCAIDKNKIWIVYESEWYSIYDGKQFKHYSLDQLNINSSLWNIGIDNDGIVWFGTWSNGIIRYDGTDYKHFNTYNGLGGNTIGRVEKDLNNNAWISSSGGTVTKYTSKYNEMIAYSNKTNFPANAVHNLVVVDNDSVIWFSPHYSSNTNIIKLDTRTYDNFPPSNNIKKIIINDSIEYRNSKKLVLPHYQNNIRFFYIGNNFRSEGLVRYKTKLEGFNSEWSELTDRTDINYTNLPAGKYTFKIKSRNQHGFWNDTPAELEFTIKPPFWKTVWFILLEITILIILIILIINLRERKLRKDKLKLENTVLERTAEINQQKEEIQAQRDDIFDKNEILLQQNEEIISQREKIEAQRDKLIHQKDEITASITYAKRIQEAVLPSPKILSDLLHNHFVLFKPRDIVSGDFYWIKKIDHYVIFVAADCTGHGVPGAFMSMLGISLLNEIVTKRRFDNAGEILNRLRKKIKSSLNQEGKDFEQKDGMDLALIIIDQENKTLQYAGANNSIYVIPSSLEKFEINSTIPTRTLQENGKLLIEIKADRQPVSIYPQEKDFSSQTIQLHQGDIIYSFSDGFADQQGGEKGKKFMSKKFKKVLLEVSEQSMQEQHDILDTIFEGWKNNFEQIDDILVAGIKIE